MKLSKQQAIEEHRKMWNWIADQLEDNIEKKQYMSVYGLKERYCSMNSFRILSNCFCCEYDYEQLGKSDCECCPLVWGTEQNVSDNYCGQGIEDVETGRETGLWLLTSDLCRKGKYKEAAEIARQIANLPEKGGYMGFVSIKIR